MTVLSIWNYAAGTVTETVDNEAPVVYSIDEYTSMDFIRDRQAEIYSQDGPHESHAVEPSNPYRDPEHGPILAMYVCPRPCPVLPSILHELAATPGYGLTWHPVRMQPRRTWSPEAIGRNRRKRLRKRLEARYPLFAERWIAAELSRDPQRYYPENYPEQRGDVV